MFETIIEYVDFGVMYFKIVFFLAIISHLILRVHVLFANHRHNHRHNKLDQQLVYWEERTEFMYNISMAILLIILFKPGKNKHIHSENSLLLFLFGLYLLVDAKWNLFITEPSWYSYIFN